MKKILLTLTIALSLALSANSVEREAVPEDQDAFVARGETQRLGYESESKLTEESAAKSFFYLNNERQLPEKKEIPAEPKPKAQPKPAVKQDEGVVEEKPAPRPPKAGVKKIAKETEAVEDTREAEPAPVKDKSRKAPSERVAAPAAPAKKPKPVKKAVALPNIEEILADVRRAAEPQTSADRQAASPAASTITPPIQYSSEVTAPVDMDQLAQDLANFQSQEAAVQKKPESKSAEAPANWWITTAVVSGTAGAIVLAVVLARRLRRRPKSRTQSQIDSETRAFFAKLATERKRAPVETPAAAPQKISQPPMSHAAPRDEEELAEAFSAAHEEIPARQEPVEEPHEPAVYLLPPELDNEAYKDVIRLAAEGAPADAIAERLNMGEGEVRLVLDLARLSHERIGTR